MSYLMPSSPPFDHSHPAQQQPPHPPLARLHMPDHALSPHTPATNHLPSPLSAQPLPKIGQIRCYWALLSAELEFIYLDPVLAYHLEQQADGLIGKPLLSFVHPDEQASAKQDLGSVLDSRTLHGSVTRFSRLSRVRRILGHDGENPWVDGDKIAVDSNYMAVDVVINWAAEGLVLCFIHAIVDLHENDNDERNKTCWTNWCGTPCLTTEQTAALYRQLLLHVPQRQDAFVTRVFQILSNQPNRPLLISWPPDQGQGPTGRDFAKLVENVQIGNGVPNTNDAKTSCTRRYKAFQDMPSIAGGAQVESIFIPHGTIIFACHKVDLPSRSTATSSATMQMGYSAPTHYSPPQSQSYYDQQPTPYPLPPLSTNHSTPYNYTSQPPSALPTPYSPARWSATGEQSNSYNQWAPNSISSLRPVSPTYLENGASTTTAYNRPTSPNYPYSPTTAVETSTTSGVDVVPPPRRRVSPGTSVREQYATRIPGNRPVGILKCSSCKATQSPEWRKGPSGKKELCNACGLRYARSRAKKEGNAQPSRRRKDKGMAKRESSTPPTPASAASYSAIRRIYDASIVSTSSAGSASGSEIYTHSTHHLIDNTSSPSPPANNVNFVHYAPGTDRQPYSSNTTSYYSVSSPLSNPPVLPPQHQQHTNSLPPLDHIASYANRLSPVLPSAASIVHSPLSATHPSSSFERDRDRDRERRDLPPTPLSAEPRQPRRSILTQ